MKHVFLEQNLKSILEAKQMADFWLVKKILHIFQTSVWFDFYDYFIHLAVVFIQKTAHRRLESRPKKGVFVVVGKQTPPAKNNNHLEDCLMFKNEIKPKKEKGKKQSDDNDNGTIYMGHNKCFSLHFIADLLNAIFGVDKYGPSRCIIIMRPCFAMFL